MQITQLPPALRALAGRIESDPRVGTKNGIISTAEVQKAKALGIFGADELVQLTALEAALKHKPSAPLTTNPSFSPWQVNDAPAAASANSQELDLAGTTLQPGQPFALQGLDPNRPIVAIEVLSGNASAKVGRDPVNKPDASGWGTPKPVLGQATLEGSGPVGKVRVTYADPKQSGNSDYYSIPVGKDGLKNGEALTLQIPPDRQGREIANINVSFHAPLRDWNDATKRENKPTYCEWYADSSPLGRKFVDPNADNGNAPEIDNVHPENDSADLGVLATAGKTVSVKAVNTDIPADETAMTVQWVEIQYKPRDVAMEKHSFRGDPLPNTEWKGNWIQPGQTLAIDVDPTRRISRVEVQWSDKPDDVGYESPGKWATGSLRLDGKPIGAQHEHVGSPEWQVFDNLRGPQGKKLEIAAESCALKVFEVKVYYES